MPRPTLEQIADLGESAAKLTAALSKYGWVLSEEQSPCWDLTFIAEPDDDEDDGQTTERGCLAFFGDGPVLVRSTYEPFLDLAQRLWAEIVNPTTEKEPKP